MYGGVVAQWESGRCAEAEDLYVVSSNLTHSMIEMEFKCKCGNVVAKGEIKIVESKRFSKNLNMEIVRRKKALLLEYKPKGTILRNNSKDPKKWSFVCSSCQRMMFRHGSSGGGAAGC